MLPTGIFLLPVRTIKLPVRTIEVPGRTNLLPGRTKKRPVGSKFVRPGSAHLPTGRKKVRPGAWGSRRRDRAAEPRSRWGGRRARMGVVVGVFGMEGVGLFC